VNKATLLAEIMQLSEEERRELVEEVCETLPPEELPPLTPEQIEEVERRIEEHERDPSGARPWHEVREWLWSRRK
jgi:putative addiction module component (TIGR02574 family)